MQKKLIPLGLSDFKTIITKKAYYVDKSLFIKDVEDCLGVALFTRPRRFGKTLNLGMLDYFYNINGDNAHLFSNLKIASETEVMQKQGKFPVIYLTFKDVRGDTWEVCYERLTDTIARVLTEFRYLLDSDAIDEYDKDTIKRILSNTAQRADYTSVLRMLSKALYQYHKVNVIILLDEYDTPIHEGYFKGYYAEIIDFMRVLFGSAFKDNKYLEKAVLTGILRVSKESLFSGLNNLEVCTVTESMGSDKFGFTEAEVVDMLNHYDNIFSLDKIKFWYDGYNFENEEIYNPWSILHTFKSKKIALHWVNTASHDLLRDLCSKADESIKEELDILTQGGSFQKEIDNNIVFSNLGNDQNALWSFLLHTGYLRYDNLVIDDYGVTKADLRTPNNEVASVFRNDIVKNWLIPIYKDKELTKITTNLISGDINVFGQEFRQYCLEAVSYYDVGGKKPEQHYHNIMLGILFCLRRIYHIKSNREAGLGRSDIMLYPKATTQYNRGIIFEFKAVNKKRKETFEQVIAEAKTQIIENKYYEELQGLGYKEIVNVIMAFAGKEVRVEVVRGEE